MGAMSRREGIVHIGIAEAREYFRQRRVVLLLARVIARILHEQALAGLGRLCRREPLAVLPVGEDESDRAAERLCERRRYGFERHFRHDLALGAIEMGEQDYRSTLVEQFAN